MNDERDFASASEIPANENGIADTACAGCDLCAPPPDTVCRGCEHCGPLDAA